MAAFFLAAFFAGFFAAFFLAAIVFSFLFSVGYFFLAAFLAAFFFAGFLVVFFFAAMSLPSLWAELVDTVPVLDCLVNQKEHKLCLIMVQCRTIEVIPRNLSSFLQDFSETVAP
ncbi:MAG: hypothetical protein HYY06_12990 [Deltaproteobacteria bacterium]|nr:hypothetical protein [Deltaproteobacteria bacterium]